MVLDTSLLNTQQYKVHIKGKVEQSRERSSAHPLHFGVVAIEKGAFWLPSTMIANFTYFTLGNFSHSLYSIILNMHYKAIWKHFIFFACNASSERTWNREQI